MVCLLLLAGRLSAMEKTIELGKQAGWADMQKLDGVTQAVGRWGLNDLVLQMAEYSPDGQTEFLFHFDAPAQADATGAYTYASNPPRISTGLSALGAGSATYQASGDGTVVSVPAGSLFSPGAAWQDFTLEFWLHPSTLSRTETLLSWKGAGMEGSSITPQSVTVSIQDRLVNWDFTNFFTLPDGKRLSLSLKGITRLLPRAWHHHLIRFDSSLGLLEYLVDGTPEAVAHTTETGREGGAVAVPRIGTGFPGQLVLGADYTGFLDELRLMKTSVDSPMIHFYSDKSGSALSSIIDLGYSGTRLARIDSVYATPSDTAVAYYYKISDSWTGPRELKTPSGWIPFMPSTKIRGKRTRQVRADPGGAVSRRTAGSHPEHFQPLHRL